jgi:hypothetical protein
VQGLAAITANNGWAMAITGASIVMIGLATLSFIISQLHKVVEMIDKKEKVDLPVSDPLTDVTEEEAAPPQADFLDDLESTAKLFQSTTTQLGETFTLQSLYQVLQSEKHPHPHITVRELREAGYLTNVGEGVFSWSNI